jgi:hypothetical protein
MCSFPFADITCFHPRTCFWVHLEVVTVWKSPVTFWRRPLTFWRYNCSSFWRCCNREGLGVSKFWIKWEILMKLSLVEPCCYAHEGLMWTVTKNLIRSGLYHENMLKQLCYCSCYIVTLVLFFLLPWHHDLQNSSAVWNVAPTPYLAPCDALLYYPIISWITDCAVNSRTFNSVSVLKEAGSCYELKIIYYLTRNLSSKALPATVMQVPRWRGV